MRQRAAEKFSRQPSFHAILSFHAISLICHTRQPGKVVYPLDETRLTSLLAVLAGAETFTDIARFGDRKLTLLRRFQRFRDRTPPHDTISAIFATLDAEQFQRCFVTWVALVTGVPAGVPRKQDPIAPHSVLEVSEYF